MSFFVTDNHFGEFISAVLKIVALVSIVTILVLTFAYFFSVPLFSPKEGEQTPFIQFLQKLLVFVVVALGMVCIYKLKNLPSDFKYLSLDAVFIGGLILFWVLLVATLGMAWARSSYPIQDQFFSILIKIIALIGVGALLYFTVKTVTDFMGLKVLPHAMGIPMRETSLFFFDATVLLPSFIVTFSLTATAALVYIIWDAIIDANIFSSNYSWLFPAPIAILSAILLFILGDSWYKYYSIIKINRADRTKYIQAENEIDENGDPSTRAQYVRLAEYFLGTREWNLPTFHPIVDDPFSLGLTFPGFLIGIEKANRNLIGVNKDEQNLTDSKIENKARQNGSRRILGDRKRSFVSHVVEFSNWDKSKSNTIDCEARVGGFGPRFHFNLYGSKKDPLSCSKFGSTAWQDPLKTYHEGFKALDHLGQVLGEHALEADSAHPYTHIIVMCMGWNTDQQEAIRNYNSLMGYLNEARNRDTSDDAKRLDSSGHSFNPLFIGLSWSSQWASLLPASYPTKADDADEVGMIWGSYLIHHTLAPIKNVLFENNKPIKVVMVGHSFGTRVLTRAMASDPAWIQRPAAPSALKGATVDLFIGLQGAFSIDRFVNRGALTGGGLENSPYLDLLKSNSRFVFTWSTEDKANPIASYVTAANHIGGNYGADLASDHPEIFTMVSYEGPHKLEKISAAHTPETNTPKTSEVFTKDGWPKNNWDEKDEKKHRIRMVDMSSVVKDTPYGKGGKAHSDIYKYQIGHFIWKTILALEESK